MKRIIRKAEKTIIQNLVAWKSFSSQEDFSKIEDIQIVFIVNLKLGLKKYKKSDDLESKLSNFSNYKLTIFKAFKMIYS